MLRDPGRQYMASPANLAALDGIRALCNAGIVMSHVVYTLGIPPYDDQWMQTLASSALLRGWWMLAFSGMDAFLTLSGLLACLHLVPAMQKSSQPLTTIVLSYLRRRVLRVIPAYYVTLIITCAVGAIGQAAGDTYLPYSLAFRHKSWPPDTSARTILSSLLFFQNQTVGGLLPFTWNLAVQVQFYVMLPLAFLALQPRRPGFQGRVAVLALLLLGGSIAYRLERVKNSNVPMPEKAGLFRQPTHPHFEQQIAAERMFYMSTIGRLANLSMGMLIGLMALSPPTIRAVQRRWRLATVAAALAGVFLAAMALGPLPVDPAEGAAPPGSYTLYVLYVWLLGFIHPGAVAIVIAFVVSNAGPVAHFASQALSSRIWKLPAKLSYNVYLMHVLAIVLVGRVAAAVLSPPSQLFKVPDHAARGGWQQWQPVALVLCLWAAVQGSATVAATALDAVLGRFIWDIQRKAKTV